MRYRALGQPARSEARLEIAIFWRTGCAVDDMRQNIDHGFMAGTKRPATRSSCMVVAPRPHIQRTRSIPLRETTSLLDVELRLAGAPCSPLAMGSPRRATLAPLRQSRHPHHHPRCMLCQRYRPRRPSDRSRPCPPSAAICGRCRRPSRCSCARAAPGRTRTTRSRRCGATHRRFARCRWRRRERHYNAQNALTVPRHEDLELRCRPGAEEDAGLVTGAMTTQPWAGPDAGQGRRSMPSPWRGGH